MRICLGQLVVACCALLGLSAFLSSADAETRPQRSGVKNSDLSCYSHLVAMLRSSSFSPSRERLSSLTLAVEVDEGEGVILRVHQQRAKRSSRNVGRNAVADLESDTLGWVLYQPASRRFTALPAFSHPLKLEATTFLEQGKSLTFDARYAYLFESCRERRDVGRQAHCAIRHRNALMGDAFSQEDNAVRVKLKARETVLYAGPDQTCLLAESAKIPAGATVTRLGSISGFDYVRYDKAATGHITGWIARQELPERQTVVPVPSERQTTTSVSNGQEARVERIRLPRSKPLKSESDATTTMQSPPASGVTARIESDVVTAPAQAETPREPVGQVERIRLPTAKPARNRHAVTRRLPRQTRDSWP